MGEFYHDNYATDHAMQRARPLPRLWPWVLAGLVLSLSTWAYLEPMPSFTTLQPVAVGPNSPLYGPMNGGNAKPLVLREEPC